MEPIRVPKPPASAFNKNRRISDLLQSQVAHLQHLEHKHELQLDPAIAMDLHTEAAAARYIANVTMAMRSRAQVAKAAPTLIKNTSRTTTVRPASMDKGLSIAAAAATKKSSRPAKPKKRKKKL